MRRVLILSKATEVLLSDILTYSLMVLFVSSIVLLVAYQLNYLVALKPSMPFFEPDNYMYYFFAQLAVSHAPLVNTYLVGAHPGFFEATGLYQLPALLAELTSIPLVWDFRILQALAVAGTYIVTLLFVRKILQWTSLNKVYHYFAYTLVVTSFLMMQYTQLIEWRGNEFITFFMVLGVYLLCYLFTEKRGGYLLVARIGIVGCVLGAIYMWSVGFLVIPSLLLVAGFLILYKALLRKYPGIWKWFMIGVVIGGIVLYFFPVAIDTWLSNIAAYFSHNFLYGCAYNALDIAEIGCLTPSNGLLPVLMMITFGTLGIVAFLGKSIFSIEKDKYEYYLFGLFAAGFSTLPFALIYIRLLDLVAPYFTALYAIGIVGLFSHFRKAGSNRIVMMLSMVLILLAGFVGQYLFYSTYLQVYSYANPTGLLQVASQIPANSTVFTYYAYGDFLEEYAHAIVYADTIQGLNYSRIESMDMVFGSNASTACHYLMNGTSPFSPEYVLVGGDMNNGTLFIHNASNNILLDPNSFNRACGYSLAYHNESWYLFKK